MSELRQLEILKQNGILRGFKSNLNIRQLKALQWSGILRPTAISPSKKYAIKKKMMAGAWRKSRR